MRQIEHEEEARQLARAILSDVRLYGPTSVVDADRPGAQTMLDEARALFRGRVSRHLYGVFDEEYRALPGPTAVSGGGRWLPVLIAVVLLAAGAALLALR